MSKKKSHTSPVNSNDPKVVEALRVVLAKSYALLTQTHLCHWNVEGPSFFALHHAFEAQYNELFTAVDDIAERIRALGAYSPGGLAKLAKIAGLDEIEETEDAHSMVSHLAKLHANLIVSLGEARDISAEVEDKETEDMMIARIQTHEKTLWMLKSYMR